MKKKYRYNLNQVYGGYSDPDFIRNYLENLRCRVCDQIDFDIMNFWNSDDDRTETICNSCQTKIDRQTKIDNLLK